MYFRYYEKLDRNKKNTPLIFVNTDSDNLDIKRTQQLSIIDFIDGFPSNTLNELDKILKFSGEYTSMYINKETWTRFQIAYKVKIPPISKEIKRTITGSGELKDNKYITAKYVENKKDKDLTFKKENFYVKGTNLNLFETSENNYSYYDIKVHKDAVFNDFRQLLYIFLECLFASNVSYYIKKCKYCNKFYIATKSDTKFCQRIHLVNNKYVTCSQVVANLQKTYEYKQLMKIDKNNISSISNKYYSFQENIDKYKNNRDELKDNYFKTKDITELKAFIENYLVNNVTD